MEEQIDVKNKIIKHFIYNIIGFATIFIIFGFLIFIMVSGMTYINIDKDLYESKEKILEVETKNLNIMIDSDLSLRNIPERWIQGTIEKYQEYMIPKKVINPNVIVIQRDSKGNVINLDNIGRITEYSDEILFNSKNINKIYELTIGNMYHYRGLNFIFEGNELTEDRYVQLLINVDSERDLISNYFNIISMAVLVGITLSIVASYILSKKTLNPLRVNIVKQVEFVQNVSHELRTPLTIIQAKQELLLQEPEAKIIDKTEDIILTLNETKRLSKLVKDLMMLSRADSNKMVLQKENINVDDYIKEIVNPYIEIAEMQEKKCVLNLNYTMDIDIDGSRFYQLMIILLDNAIKYTESGDTIEIKTYLKDSKFNLEICDTGIGVSEEGLKRIFERFYREDQARSRETGGSGLGLSIAKFIVTSHGGTIKATHNSPKGTIFTIKLPK